MKGWQHGPFKLPANCLKLPRLSQSLQHQRLLPRTCTTSDGREPSEPLDASSVKPPTPPAPVPESILAAATAAAGTAPLSTPAAEVKPSTSATAVSNPLNAPAASAATTAAEPSASIADDKKKASKPQSEKLRSFPVDLSDDDLFGTKGLMQELTDQQKFGKRGEAWFFAQMLVVLLILFPPMELKGLLDLVGTLAISAGMVFLAYALFCLGQSLSPLPAPRASNKLVVTGMYGYVRHPMYGGLILVAIGMTLVTGSESRLALSLLLWWILEQKSNVEEMLLQQLHPEYEAYKSRVKKFIPYIY